MPHNFQIRVGMQSDVDRLSVLAAQVWLHTYCTKGISSEIAQYVLSELTAERFCARLTDPESHILVAECDEYLVGFAVVRFGVSCPASAALEVELQTLYVQEHFTGQGVGWALLVAAEAKAREQAIAPLWLRVNAQNARAIAFYARQGYSKVGTTYFALGQGRYENHVLVGPDTNASVKRTGLLPAQTLADEQGA